MKSQKKSMTRRTFIKQGAGAAVTAGCLIHAPVLLSKPAEAKSHVVLVRDSNLFDSGNKLRKNVITRMIDDGLSSLFEVTDAHKAWQKICTADDIVGIKTNVTRPPTPDEVNDCILKRVLDMGVSRSNVSINDRGVRTDKVFQNATVLINVRPLRTHHWSGVGSLIKNYIMFVPQPWTYHDDACADLGAIWQLPEVKGKTRLNILVMFQPLFHGIGPHHYNPKYTWRYNGLIVGQDPVAVDTIGLHILLAKRKLYFKEEKPLIPSPKHIEYAHSRHGIGVADMNKIKLVRLGWTDNSLI